MDVMTWKPCNRWEFDFNYNECHFRFTTKVALWNYKFWAPPSNYLSDFWSCGRTANFIVRRHFRFDRCILKFEVCIIDGICMYIYSLWRIDRAFGSILPINSACKLPNFQFVYFYLKCQNFITFFKFHSTAHVISTCVFHAWRLNQAYLIRGCRYQSYKARPLCWRTGMTFSTYLSSSYQQYLSMET